MTIPLDPHNECDCCGHGFNIALISVPPVEIESINCPIIGGPIARCWEFTVAGMVNNLCTLCSNFNGTHTVIFQDPQPSPSSTCHFQQPLADSLPSRVREGVSCLASSTRYTLQVRSITTSDGKVQLSAASSGLFLYLMDTIDFDPLGPNVLTNNSTNTACSGWPATITIEPLPVCP